MLEHLKLTAADLKLTINLCELTPNQISRDHGIVGQARAQSALAFGVAMKAPGYNIFVMGEPGTGRLSMVSHYLSGNAEHQESPLSYAYVENFETRASRSPWSCPPARAIPSAKTSKS